MNPFVHCYEPSSFSPTFCESLRLPQGSLQPKGCWQSTEAHQRVPEIPRHRELESLGVGQEAPGLEQQGPFPLGVGAEH